MWVRAVAEDIRELNGLRIAGRMILVKPNRRIARDAEGRVWWGCWLTSGDYVALRSHEMSHMDPLYPGVE